MGDGVSAYCDWYRLNHEVDNSEIIRAVLGEKAAAGQRWLTLSSHAMYSASRQP